MDIIHTYAMNDSLELGCTVAQEEKAVRDTTGTTRKSKTQATGEEGQHWYGHSEDDLLESVKYVQRRVERRSANCFSSSSENLREQG